MNGGGTEGDRKVTEWRDRGKDISGRQGEIQLVLKIQLSFGKWINTGTRSVLFLVLVGEERQPVD